MHPSDTLKQTALVQIHQQLGAKMVPFAGYLMPLQYAGITAEHHGVRNSVGMFDVSHMGEFILKGPNALQLIQNLTTNDASKLTPGKAQYSCITNNNGGIIDDLIVYCLDPQSYMLVVNASNIQKDWDWFVQHNELGVEMHNISDKTSLLAVQGPNALKTLQKLTAVNLSQIPYYNFVKGELGQCPNVLISNTGYTGAGGFELYFENQYAAQIWNQILDAGAEFGIVPAGLGARDTLRLEMGFCLYGNDIDDTTSPLEAGLGWITKFSKPFTQSKALQQQKEQGPKRKLVAFKMTERGIPRSGYGICNAQGQSIGHVTSGTQSPTLNEAIGLGYVASEYAVENADIFIAIRNQNVKATIVKLPFVKK